MSNELPTFQDLLERDAEKIKEMRKVRSDSKIEPEWVMLAEFGMYFGYQALQDVRHDVISFAEMNKLLTAARRLEALKRYNNVIDSWTVTIAPHDKSKAVKQTLKGIKDSLNE